MVMMTLGAALFHSAPRPPRAEGTEAVINDVYLHAMTLPIDKCISKGLSDWPVGKYVHRNIYVVVGAANRRQHCIICGRAVFEHREVEQVDAVERGEQVGQFAAKVRSVRPPEPYNAKGIKYENERIQRKAGKSFASAGAGG